MTARQIIESLQKLSEEEFDLPVIAIDTSSGVSYDISIDDSFVICSNQWSAGPLIDLEGQKYIPAYIK